MFAPRAHVSILSVPGGENAVMLCAASKTFNVAGLQQSAIGCRDAQVREAIRREMSASGVVCGNVFALAATRAAYTDCDAWLDGLKAYLIANRDFACAYLAEHMPSIRVTPLQATYLMWLDCRALGLSQKTLLARIREAGVTILLVEQNARMALNVSDRGYVMETGKIVMTGSGQELLHNERVIEYFLGGK